MVHATREDFYLEELRRLHAEIEQLNQSIGEMNADRTRKLRLVRHLVSVLRIEVGENAAARATELFHGTARAPRVARVAAPTTARRRARRHRLAVPLPDFAVPKNTPIKMLAGIYQGWTGIVKFLQAKEGSRGIEVTYTLHLDGPNGARGRTSVKHVSLGRSWDRI